MNPRQFLDLPADIHWFCDNEGPASLYHEHTGPESPPKIIADLQFRQDEAVSCLTLYSYSDAAKYQQAFAEALDKQLARCDVCIVENYRARQRFIDKLGHEYPEETISQLQNAYSKHDFERITKNLDRIERKLRNVEPELRTKNLLDLEEQLGLFEALCNTPFLQDDFLLDRYFQTPFNWVQTRKPLSIPYYVPAATIFLFGKHYERRKWASFVWSKYRENISQVDFDFAIRDTLFSNLQSIFPVVNEPADLGRIWHGIGLILNRADNSLVTHSLRALEIDIFKVVLETLRYDVPGFLDLIQVVGQLLKIAPKDFWDSMGTISPTTFIEQIYNNPGFDRIMEHSQDDDPSGVPATSLNLLLTWIEPFISSLDTAQQAPACRSLAFQLLNRLQADRFPPLSRAECFKIGLLVLARAVDGCSLEGLTSTSTGRIVASEILDIVGDHITGILRRYSQPLKAEFVEGCMELCNQMIHAALLLDCKCLQSDYDALKLKRAPPQARPSPSPAIWDAVALHINRSNLLLAQNLLVGSIELSTLEKVKITSGTGLEKESKEFNQQLSRLTHFVFQILERVNDFNPADLDYLFSDTLVRSQLLSSLLSPNASLYEAGVNLIKSVSSEFARKEAVGHLLKTGLRSTLDAYSMVLERIARARVYSPCPRMLRTSADILETLCDSQDGLLRMQVEHGDEEIEAVERFWKAQWELLGVIYQSTESWGQAHVAEGHVLKEFCRDTMQLSERLFTEYGVFANALVPTVAVKSEHQGHAKGRDTRANLLKYPNAIMDGLIKWLRLRDAFLLEISSHLTKQILNRLTENELKLSERPASFLEQIVNSSKQAKTNLQPQEKAEIGGALEANLKRPIFATNVIDLDSDNPSDRSNEPAAKSDARNNGAIDVEKWVTKTQKPIVVNKDADNEFQDSDFLDKELLSVSRSVEKMHRMKEQQKSLPSRKTANMRENRQHLPGPKSMSIVAANTNNQTAEERASFRQKREAEREAKKKRDAQTSAMLKRRAGIGGQTASEGSGVGGLGIKGKDHAPKGPSMMVSSGSESESDELDEELFGKPAKTAQKNEALREYERSRALQMKAGPIKKQRQVRSAKDMRARLAPDLTNLHQIILGWDFFHEGVFPPGSNEENYDFVASTFRTPDEYCRTFEPLLVLEAWQGFLQSKEEGNFRAFEFKIASRMNVDTFLEISTTLPMAVFKDVALGEADVVLVSKGKSPDKDKHQPHCLARIWKIARKKAVVEITYRANVSNGLTAALLPNATLHATKVDSITPLEREYGALQGLKYYDLCDEIIRGRPSPLLPYTEQQLSSMAQIYDVNHAQAKAVKSAVDNDAFTLIQGPPGSGKTKTIVAIVGALLTGSLAEPPKGVAINHPPNGGMNRPLPRPASKKLLVCAPSNAAVDELVIRFKEGVKSLRGHHQKISVVRLGRSDAINSKVLDVTLEELVNAKLNAANGKPNVGSEDIQKLMISHKATCENLNVLRDKVDSLKADGKTVDPELSRDLEGLKKKKQKLSNDIDAARDKGSTVARDAEIRRRHVQQEILDSCHVICATLSGSGHDMFQTLNVEFETVIIDEAAQSIELSALIPLKYGCAKCILVGDPKQLPPTVLSRDAARFRYEQSLFVRMQENHSQWVHLLDTQYRMHPEISLFPSNAFYDGRLVDGPGMARLRSRPWHRKEILGPYRFFDVQGMHQSAPRGHSLINLAEIEAALLLYERLLANSSTYDLTGKVGIITPYKSQLRELRSRFAARHGDHILSSVDFNTTDSFQGRESEVIIFSCVRASSGRGIGFLADIRRMNVGITRAKASLWVLGNARSLAQGEFWGRMIQDARDRKLYIDDISALQRSLVDAAPSAEIMDLDTEMPDAPLHETGPPHVKTSQNDTGSSRRPETNEVAAAYPSGGMNGLNDKMACYVCGSLLHQTSQCDNQEAKESSLGKCFRCEEPGHTRHSCKAELCVTCGQIGHTQARCVSSTVLPKKERERLVKRESDHRSNAHHDQEAARRKQLGDHDRKVPLVRSTQQDDPSEAWQKRLLDKKGPDGQQGQEWPVNSSTAASNHMSPSTDDSSDYSKNTKPNPLPRAGLVPKGLVRPPKRKLQADPLLRPRKK